MTFQTCFVICDIVITGNTGFRIARLIYIWLRLNGTGGDWREYSCLIESSFDKIIPRRNLQSYTFHIQDRGFVNF
jgi:hypothetical protein